MTQQTGAADYQQLLTELDKSIQEIKAAAFKLKETAEGMQAVECNVDRLLASTRMLEINVSDLLGEPQSLASWTESEARLR
jgi:hypothetical protein